MAPNAALEKLVLECLDHPAGASEFCRNDRFVLRREFRRLVASIVEARR